HFRRDPVHAAGGTIVVPEHCIFDWTTRHLLPGPTKQVRIELSGLLRVVCAELIPAKRVWGVVNASAALLFCLPQRKYRAGWILDHRHTAQSRHVEWSIQESGAFSFRLFRCFVGIFDGNIAEPVRGNSLC